ncbi:hypothetical protein CYMTET_30506, partial [Cymbomonas tetramitiformis]
RCRSNLELTHLPELARERLAYFVNTMDMLSKRCKLGKEIPHLADCHAGAVPTLSVLIPCYAEEIILTRSYLLASDGVSTNLAFIITEYRGEWELLAEKHGMSTNALLHEYYTKELKPSLQDEVELWASYRSQTVVRTVRGAANYLKALDVLYGEGASHKLSQLIIAHQTYGSRNKANPKAAERRDTHVEWMLKEYCGQYPVFLVFDFDRGTARKEMAEMVDSFLIRQRGRGRRFSQQPEAWEDISMVNSLSYCTCYARWSEEKMGMEILHVIPRVFPLRLGKKAKTQGKAANQRSCLHFTTGAVLQMLDSNMGAFIGESFKVPYVTRRIQPFRGPDRYDRRVVRNRIVGFREFIFTQQHGAVGNAMATSEWVFGTIFQRTLGDLDVRMHYGHPDFFDAFWALNRGSVSKASPILNVSEDMFAGLNLLSRGEKSRHSDMLEYEKGREAAFTSAGTFLVKISQGAVSMLRTREFHVIYSRMPFHLQLSFFYASSGWSFNTAALQLGMNMYLYCFFWLALGSLSVNDLGVLKSALGAEWVINMGFITMAPQIVELTLEYGPVRGVIKWAQSSLATLLFFSFHNRTVSHTILTSVGKNEADYAATGRPNPNVHFSFKRLYLIYWHSHYNLAQRLILFYAMYRILSAEIVDEGSLPIIFLVACITSWLVAPVVFNPQPRWGNLKANAVEFLDFIVTVPQQSAVRLGQKLSEDTLYETGLRDLIQESSRGRWNVRLLELVPQVLFAWLLAGSYPSIILDCELLLVFTGIMHVILTILWELSGRSNMLLLFILMLWALVPLFGLLVLPASHSYLAMYLLVFFLFFKTVCALRNTLLLVAQAVVVPVGKAPRAWWRRLGRIEVQNVEHADAKFVEWLYFRSMTYHLRVFTAGLILLVDMTVHLVLTLLELLGGLHTMFLLNSQLGTGLLQQIVACASRPVKHKKDDDIVL